MKLLLALFFVGLLGTSTSAMFGKRNYLMVLLQLCFKIFFFLYLYNNSFSYDHICSC